MIRFFGPLFESRSSIKFRNQRLRAQFELMILRTTTPTSPHVSLLRHAEGDLPLHRSHRLINGVLTPMNKDTIPKTVLLCEKQIERPVDPVPSGNSSILSAGKIERQLIWSSLRPDDWEILVYKQADGWEACFFRWPLHHEHATGSSFDSVRQRAEQRIRALEARRLKGTSWQPSVAATTFTAPQKPAVVPRSVACDLGERARVARRRW